jgi:hypothetical protein
MGNFFSKKVERTKQTLVEKNQELNCFFNQTNIISVHGPYATLLYETMGLQLIALASSHKDGYPKSICKKHAMFQTT